MPYRVLFLCTGNSARSVLAEATLRAWASARFDAFSAGSKPTGAVHPLTLETLRSDGIAVDGLRSKSWDEFDDETQPLDVVVTVCDSAAAEPCPVFFGHVVRTHWGLADPAAVEGTDEARRQAFADAHAIVKTRLAALLGLPDDTWSDAVTLKVALDRIGTLVPER